MADVFYVGATEVQYGILVIVDTVELIEKLIRGIRVFHRKGALHQDTDTVEKSAQLQINFHWQCCYMKC